MWNTYPAAAESYVRLRGLFIVMKLHSKARERLAKSAKAAKQFIYRHRFEIADALVVAAVLLRGWQMLQKLPPGGVPGAVGPVLRPRRLSKGKTKK